MRFVSELPIEGTGCTVNYLYASGVIAQALFTVFSLGCQRNAVALDISEKYINENIMFKQVIATKKMGNQYNVYKTAQHVP